MIVNGREMSGTKRRREQRQKPRSGIATVIAAKGLAEGLIKNVGETQYAYKEFTAVIREKGKVVGAIHKYQFVKV